MTKRPILFVLGRCSHLATIVRGNLHVSGSIICLFGIVWGGVGCAAGDPYDTKVESRTPVLFLMWQSSHRSKFPLEQWKVFELSLQEYKYHASLNARATGATEIDDFVRESIDGATVRSIIVTGLGYKLDRFEKEKIEMERIQAANARLKTRPDDADSANFLNSLRSGHENQYARILDEIKLAKQQMLFVQTHRP